MEFINDILGLNADDLKLCQLLVRAFLVFWIALAFIRIAGIRSLGRQTAFDELTSLMLGAILGKAVVTPKPFLGSIAAALLIMLLHRLVARITFKSHKAGKILKGDPILIFKEGQFDYKAMKKEDITKEDVEESMRTIMCENDLANVKEAYIERSGEISVISKKHD